MSGIYPPRDDTSGFVVGPASSTNNDIVVFDGATGKIIKDSGISIGSLPTGSGTTNRLTYWSSATALAATTWSFSSGNIASLTSGQTISVPGAGASSQIFGLLATSAGLAGTAVGNGATCTGDYSVVVGSAAGTQGVYSVALGYQASIAPGAGGAVAIGAGSSIATAGGTSVCIGRLTTTSGGSSIAIGTSANATGLYSIAIGSAASATIGTGAIAIGAGAAATATDYNVIIGYGASDGGNSQQVIIGAFNGTPLGQSVLVGYNITTGGSQMTCVGVGTTGNPGATVVGYSSSGSDYAVSVGYGCNAKQGAVAIGNSVIGVSSNNVAIGSSIDASDANKVVLIGGLTGLTGSTVASSIIAIGLGMGLTIDTSSVIAIGINVNANDIDNIVIGNGSLIDTGSQRSIVIGHASSVRGTSSPVTVIGYGAVAGSSDFADVGVLIGDNTTLDSDHCVCIGSTAQVFISSDYSTCLGFGSSSGSSSGSQYSVCLGANTATAGGDYNIMVGYSATVSGYTGSIAIGSVVSPSASAQCVIGSTVNNITDFVIGTTDDSSTVGDVIFRLSRRAGTNALGANLAIRPGNGTGTQGSGGIVFQTAPAGASGSTAGTMATRMVILNSGRVGVGTSVPTALLHITAGTTAASTAPLKFTSGSLLTTAEAGAVEFLTDKFYGTITTGAARKELALADIALTSGRVPFNTTNGRLTDASSFLFSSSTGITLTDLDFALGTTTGTKIGTATTQKLGFYNKTPVVQQADGAGLTNNVTSGGTTDTIANYTDLIIYANDSAAIRNDIYQLARKVKIIGDALRTYGLLS